MGSARGFHERALLRVWVPDVLTMLLLFELALMPMLALGVEEVLAWTASGLVSLFGFGLLLLRVDELLAPVETALRWNDWGLAVIDRSGRVTRSLPWHLITSHRVDRCVDASPEDVLVLISGDFELSVGASSGAGDLAIDRPALRALVAHFERTGLPRAPGRERRATRWRLGWTWRSFLVAVLWTLGSTYLAAARSSMPTGVLVSFLPALWVGHRTEALLAALRDSVAGRGMLRARLLRVVPRGLVVDDGRERFVEAAPADPRDGSNEASRRLGPLTWASGSRVLVTGPAPEGYRSASGGAARGAVSVPERSRARRAVALALLALLVLAFGAAATASYRTLWPAFRRLERPPGTACSCGDAATIRPA